MNILMPRLFADRVFCTHKSLEAYINLRRYTAATSRLIPPIWRCRFLCRSRMLYTSCIMRIYVFCAHRSRLVMVYVIICLSLLREDFTGWRTRPSAKKNKPFSAPKSYTNSTILEYMNKSSKFYGNVCVQR